MQYKEKRGGKKKDEKKKRWEKRKIPSKRLAEKKSETKIGKIWHFGGNLCVKKIIEKCSFIRRSLFCLPKLKYSITYVNTQICWTMYA